MQKNSMDAWKKQLAASARKTKTPAFAQFELTGRCNLDCKMCYVHNHDAAYCLKHELSTEQWKQIFDAAYDSGMLFASLTGGECLLRKDFKELYLHLWNKRVFVTVLTNGTLLNADYVEFFQTYKPQLVQISLYGLDEAGYVRVTGHKGFEKTLAAIHALKDAGVNVRVTVTPSRYMQEDYLRIIQFCKEQDFPCSPTSLQLMPNRDDPGKNDYQLSIDEIVDMSCKRAMMSCELKPIAIDDLPKPCGDCSKKPATGMNCNAGNCFAYVTWDGRMVPCGNAIIGEGASVREMSFAEAWEQTKKAADSVVHGIECVGCPYDKACVMCPTMRLTDLHSGHCNPDVCELTRRLVAAGALRMDQQSEDPQEL